MNTNFIETPLNFKEILKNSPIETCFLENNEKQVSSIYRFLQGNKKLFLLNGFTGTGKTSFVNFIGTQLNDNVLSIKYTCFETTILDDMLLSFFESFKNFTIQGKIPPLKIKSENFVQKINTYFNSVSAPILIFIDAFNTILKENKSGILNFIFHISKLENVKVIISSRCFNYDDFCEVDYESSSLLALSKELFEKFLRNNGIKNIGVITNELYKLTKGYYFYVNLSVKIMKLRGCDIVKFLDFYSKSLLSFPDFILKDALSFVDPVSMHLFRLLAVMRIPIHINLLKSLHLFNEQSVMFFLDNSILAFDGESLYLPDYYREIIETRIQNAVMIKFHRSCVELYETQLPLKPLERDLRLSRQTMRNEIDYHSLFIPQKPVIIPKAPVSAPVKIPTKEKDSLQQATPTREEKIQKINFIIEDEGVLNNIADSIVDYVNEKIEKKELEEKITTLNLTQLLNEAKNEESNYNYKSASMLYQSALTKKDDDNFDTFLPTVYLKLAQVYKKMSQWYEALEYYTKVQDFYSNISDEIKVCEIKLEIAKVYSSVYKPDNAKYILNTLDKNINLPNELRIKVNLAQGKLTDNINEEYSYYKNALMLVDDTTDKKVTAELYYEFANISNDKDDPQTALIYYKKCIETNPNPEYNRFVSLSYSNIAALCDEAGDSKAATDFYKKSLEADDILKNYNGLYINSRNLSEIYASYDEKQSLKYLNKSMEYAKQMNEPYYMADTMMEIGNFYLLRKNYKNSLDYLTEAYNIAKESFSKDNVDKITSKIEYVKNLRDNNG